MTQASLEIYRFRWISLTLKSVGFVLFVSTTFNVYSQIKQLPACSPTVAVIMCVFLPTGEQKYSKAVPAKVGL